MPFLQMLMTSSSVCLNEIHSNVLEPQVLIQYGACILLSTKYLTQKG